jgi:hypothetical protein
MGFANKEPTMTRTRVLLTICLSVLAATSAWSQTNPASGQDGQAAPIQIPAEIGGPVAPGQLLHRAGIIPTRGVGLAGLAAASKSPQNIPYLGGPVLPNTTIYAIWWGNPSDFPSDARNGVDDFLESLDGSAYLHIADQYLFGQQAHTHFGGNFIDNSPPPTQDPPTTEIVAEVYNVLTGNGVKPDPTALYAVYTSNFPNENYYCAFHDYDPAPDGTLVHVIYVPNIADNLYACAVDADPFFTAPFFTPNLLSEGTRSMANSTAHEVMESITDPNTDTWVILPSYTEIGDPCNFLFQSVVPLTDSGWRIQEIWSNQAGGCVQGAGHDARLLGAVSSSGAITTFDIPAATYGTFSGSINIFGAVTGYYADVYNIVHGFVRNNQGNITTFDPPRAYTSAPQSINANGAVTGFYVDNKFVAHGFVRDPRGNFVTIDAPGASATNAFSINNDGVIAGTTLTKTPWSMALCGTPSAISPPLTPRAPAPV